MNQEFINDLALKLQRVGALHAVGETWISIDSTIPAGGIPYLGQLVNRSTWADLFAWASANGKVKTEAEWEEFATYHGGNCPFYSEGDGSTTFRMPCIKSYLKGADTLDSAGSYTSEGLPDITGYWTQSGLKEPINTDVAGAFSKYTGKPTGSQVTGGSASTGFDFAASRSNPVYGNSNHVTPETHSILIGVYAVGIAANVGSADATKFLAGLATVEANLESHIRVVESWSDGTNWYRKWSDGWIEQGGIATGGASVSGAVITLPTPFTTNTYSLVGSVNRDSNLKNAAALVVVFVNKFTTTFLASTMYSGGGAGAFGTYAFGWYASGY